MPLLDSLGDSDSSHEDIPGLCDSDGHDDSDRDSVSNSHEDTQVCAIQMVMMIQIVTVS